MGVPIPKIDLRDVEAILEEVRALVPFYTPEWTATEETDPGVALLKIFAKQFEGLIRRLNEAPLKNFVAFLDMLNIKLLPAQPARAPIAFALSAGAPESVVIPSRSQATAAPPEGSDPIVFETEKAIQATPAQLQAILSVVPARDEIFDHTSDLLESATAELFADADQNLQEHAFYLGDSNLFDLNSKATITLQWMTTASKWVETDFTDLLSWEWWGEDHWVPSTVPAFQDAISDFPAVASLETAIAPTDSEVAVTTDVESDARFPDAGLLLIDNEIIEYAAKIGNRFTGVTRGFGVSNQIPGSSGSVVHAMGTEIRAIDYPLIAKVTNLTTQLNGRKRIAIELTKGFDTAFTKRKVNEIENLFIRCRTLKTPALKASPLRNLTIDTVQAGTAADAIDPDALFHNDVPLEIPDPTLPPIYPYGTRPRTFDTFYLASRDALSKRGTPITLAFGVTDTESLLVQQVQGVGATFASRLIAQGIARIDQLLEKGAVELARILDTNETRALNILEAAQKAFYDKTGVSTTTAEGADDSAEGPTLSWEYWNGSGWKKIPDRVDTTNKLRQNGSVTFPCPEDIATTAVNGEENYWIRVRIVSGGYGQEKFTFDGEKIESDTSEIDPPVISSLKIQYSPVLRRLEQCLTYNNLNFTDRTVDAQTASVLFQPFQQMDDANQGLYLGFDAPPVKGPISVFFSLEEQEYTEKNRPRMEWEYFREREGQEEGEWARLEILDGTKNLTESGTIEFIGPSDFAQLTRYGRSLYWVRAVDIEDGFQPSNLVIQSTSEAERASEATESLGDLHQLEPCEERLESFHPRFSAAHEADAPPAPRVNGIHLNTAWAIQAETVRDEILGSSNGVVNQTFTLTKFPIVAEEEIWVNELGALSEGERKELAAENPDDVDEVTDEAGDVTAFWIRWHPIDDIAEATETDRVYTIDRTFGQIQFGDGVQGMVPPIGRDNITANYRAGGGTQGNVEAEQITALRTTIPFVDGVSNPEMAGGGADTELLESALERGPQVIKNRGRAVTVEDFEWIAREASQAIARVKCLPLLNDQGEYETNWVTVIIVPESQEDRPMPSPQLRNRVEEYLRDRAANVLSFPEHIQVVGPTYVEVRVSADLFPTRIDLAPQVESEAFSQLIQFLHPLTGGYQNRGWEFGRLPCLSDFYALLEAIEGVDHVENLSMSLQAVTPIGASIDKPKLVTEDRPLTASTPEYTLIYSGEHQITVKPLR